MVLSIEEKKERNIEFYEKNKEKLAECMKTYYDNNKEKCDEKLADLHRKEYMKKKTAEFYEYNKEKFVKNKK